MASKPFGPMRVVDWIRRHLDLELGLATISAADISDALSLKRSSDLEACHDARMRMGFIRYESRHGRDARYMDRALLALEDYKRTGNREFLVDAANYVELEWIHPQLENTFFEAKDHE